MLQWVLSLPLQKRLSPDANRRDLDTNITIYGLGFDLDLTNHHVFYAVMPGLLCCYVIICHILWHSWLVALVAHVALVAKNHCM